MVITCKYDVFRKTGSTHRIATPHEEDRAKAIGSMHKSWQRLDVHNRRYAHGQTNTVTSEHIPFLLFSFSVLHFLAVVSVRQIKLTHVGFRAHVKLASRIVSYRNTQTDMLIAILRSPTVVGLISCQFHVSTRTVVSLFRWTKSCHLVLLSSTTWSNNRRRLHATRT